jgi:hypothetical protein
MTSSYGGLWTYLCGGLLSPCTRLLTIPDMLPAHRGDRVDAMRSTYRVSSGETSTSGPTAKDASELESAAFCSVDRVLYNSLAGNEDSYSRFAHAHLFSRGWEWIQRGITLRTRRGMWMSINRTRFVVAVLRRVSMR